VPRSTGDEIIFDAGVLISTDGQETEIASLAPANEIYQKLKVAASLLPTQISFV
jgi:hypothetical protein